MYEENLAPLPNGDFTQVFAELLAEIARGRNLGSPPKISPDNVVQWASTEIWPYLVRICRRLLLPGSTIAGAASLLEMRHLALQGRSCLLCMNHRSNLDGPTLYALLEDQKLGDVFHRIIWIAGRKLEEDLGATRVLVQGVNRVVVTPKSWMAQDHSADEWHEASQVNLAAHRAIRELKHQGWIFALFPTATRIRPHDRSTTHAIEETDSYLRNFEFMVLGHIDGCTLPVSRDYDLTHETPVLARVRYSFGKILRTDEWRANVARRYPQLDARAASARGIVDDIESLVTDGRS
jgi:1-acyl-sn-glycerol-3-phosphate acyltransferase